MEILGPNSQDGLIVLEAQGLSRKYLNRDLLGRKTGEILAVDGITFDVRKGEIFGVIGPNGAGKTTTIKMLTTLLIPTSGTARVLGFDVRRQTYDIRRRIGVVFGGERGLYNRVTGLENLQYFSDLYGISRSVSKQRIPELLELVGLRGREGDRVEKYSRGMKQRLHIAKALVNDPEVIFLDEPTIGLDPEGARSIRTLLKQMRVGGKTVLLTTHYMYEADELCDRIAVISKGRIAAIDKPSNLKLRVKEMAMIVMEVYGPTEDLVREIRALDGVSGVFVDYAGEREFLKIRTQSGPELLGPLKKLVEQRGVRVIEAGLREPTLEDAYLRLVTEG